MSYNPQLHHRRSFRLKGYDYAQLSMDLARVLLIKLRPRSIIGKKRPMIMPDSEFNELRDLHF